jgi:hypothetical protein
MQVSEQPHFSGTWSVLGAQTPAYYILVFMRKYVVYNLDFKMEFVP